MSLTSSGRAFALHTARAASRLVVLPALAIGTAVALAAGPAMPAQAATHHRHHHHHVRHRRRAPLGRSARRESRAMRIAVAQKGKPYRYGAAGPRAFDCSGLTSFAFHRAGFRGMPRTAASQAHFVRHIRRSRMRRGDLVFFTGGGGVYHVALYAGFVHGHRMVLHAPYPGQRVHTQRLWTNAWFPGTLRFR
jgi:cell wall-associated NlpC family hydrolase